MAESKRADPEEKYELPVPPFDAPGYVAKEKVLTRAAVVLGLLGVLLGQFGAIVAFMTGSALGSIALFLFGLVLLKAVLELTGVDYQGWDKKTWAGQIAVLFFTFLAGWIIFQNPPFMA